MNLSHAKINLAFGASLVIRKPIYSMPSKATSSFILSFFCFFALSLPTSQLHTHLLSGLRDSSHTASDTQQKMAEHIASKITFIAISKLV